MTFPFHPDFTMAFQPIVNLTNKSVIAHEALVRGSNGESAATVFLSIRQQFRCLFDQECRRAAFRLADSLLLSDTKSNLSINFLPNCINDPADDLASAQVAAETYSLTLDRIIFECRDSKSLDVDRAIHIFQEYRSLGFLTSLDHFGPTKASLELLPKFRPDFVKLG